MPRVATMLHILGDALGSLGIIICSLIIRYGEPLLGRYRVLADPILSLLIVGIILSTTIPVLLQAARVLLNLTPEGVDLKLLRKEILAIPHVLDVHALYVWAPSSAVDVSY